MISQSFAKDDRWKDVLTIFQNRPDGITTEIKVAGQTPGYLRRSAVRRWRWVTKDRRELKPVVKNPKWF